MTTALIERALRSNDSFPCELLIEVLPHLRSCGAADPISNRSAALVRDGLSAAAQNARLVQASISDAIAAEEMKISQTVEARASSFGQTEKATDAVSGCRTSLEASTRSVRAAEPEAAEALINWQVVNGEVAQTRSVADKVEAEQAKLQDIKRGDVGELDELEALGFEKALVAATEQACKTPFESRKHFDTFTLEAVSEELSAAATAAREKLSAQEPEEALVEAERLGLWAILDVAKDKEKENRKLLAEAEQTLLVAEAEVTNLRKWEAEAELTMLQKVSEQRKAAELVAEIGAATEGFEALLHAPAEVAPTRTEMTEDPSAAHDADSAEEVARGEETECPSPKRRKTDADSDARNVLLQIPTPSKVI